MITNQNMQRNFNGNFISQRTKDSYFNATELLAIYNQSAGTQKRFKDYWDNNSTKEFIKEVEKDVFYNGDNCPHYKNTINSSDITIIPNCYETKRGKGGSTWMHPYLFIDFSMWLSPNYKLQIIKWVYDNLIDFRNQAGDHYKEMCKALCDNYESLYKEKPNYLIYIKEANFLNNLVYNEIKGGKRNVLSEKELNLMNQLQILNTKLIEKELSTNERHVKLFEYSKSYKEINF
jgi:hypothetical protein